MKICAVRFLGGYDTLSLSACVSQLFESLHFIVWGFFVNIAGIQKNCRTPSTKFEGIATTQKPQGANFHTPTPALVHPASTA